MNAKTVHEPEEELLSVQEAWQDYLTLKKMEMKEYFQQILGDILILPEYKIIEVADFVQFLCTANIASICKGREERKIFVDMKRKIYYIYRER